MEKRELRKSLMRLQENKEDMKKYMNRNFLSEKEKNNFIRQYYVLEGRIRQLQLLIAGEEFENEIIKH